MDIYALLAPLIETVPCCARAAFSFPRASSQPSVNSSEYMSGEATASASFLRPFDVSSVRHASTAFGTKLDDEHEDRSAGLYWSWSSPWCICTRKYRRLRGTLSVHEQIYALLGLTQLQPACERKVVQAFPLY